MAYANNYSQYDPLASPQLGHLHKNQNTTTQYAQQQAYTTLSQPTHQQIQPQHAMMSYSQPPTCSQTSSYQPYVNYPSLPNNNTENGWQQVTYGKKRNRTYDEDKDPNSKAKQAGYWLGEDVPVSNRLNIALFLLQPFYIKYAFRVSFPNVTDVDINKYIGFALDSAGDRSGGRKERKILNPKLHIYLSPSLRTPANALVMNLAISDALMMSKMPVFIFNSLSLGPVLGSVGCRIYGFVGGLSGTLSICTLAAISLNRYYVIKFPLNMRFTSTRSKLCIIIAWIYSVIFASIPLFDSPLGSYVPEGYLTSCSFDYLSPVAEVKIFILIFFVAAWAVPFTMITFCYIHIWIAVLETRNVAKTGKESSRNIKEDEKRRQDLKLAGTIFLIIILWFTAWTPYAVVALLGISNNSKLITPLASMIPALFCKTASCIDPFIYAITNPKFKYEVKKCFFKGSLRAKPSTKIWTTQYSSERQRSTKRDQNSSQSASEEVKEEIVMLSGTQRQKLNKESELARETLLSKVPKPTNCFNTSSSTPAPEVPSTSFQGTGEEIPVVPANIEDTSDNQEVNLTLTSDIDKDTTLALSGDPGTWPELILNEQRNDLILKSPSG
ncbi:hypothetical protein RN001_005313 [Aquatica leii]|uniref:G-protein coupled receptors family 1 profile domain-containing protein n=1 Tax=Aquatica leii TaxID=1421715 RepID=A0AAN7PCB8_9COLE|nr:hypothetical protein RN001_005313 [Aquatica leii]